MDFSRDEDCNKKICVGADDLLKKGRELMKKRVAGDSVAGSTAGPSSSTPASSGDAQKVDGKGRGCPVDKDELGEASWKLLHSMSVYYPEKPSASEQKAASDFVQSFAKLYPCDVCAKDLREDIVAHPPRVEGREAFAGWMCLLHNRVNEKLGKPLFDCTRVFERWRDGWKDGSCEP